MGLRVLEAALFLLFILPLCSAQSTYYVTPTPDTPCPGPQDPETCQTFSEYALQSFQYFLSNTTFEFLPGDHVLENSIFVGDVTNLTLRGNSASLPRVTSKIVCRGVSSAMVFSNVSKLTLTALAFSSCGNGSSSQMTNCNFLDSINVPSLSLGGALAVIMGDAIVSNNTFENNYADSGGGVAVLLSTVEFIGNTFRNSNANDRGGGVDVSSSVVNFTENSFLSNTAGQSGGAVSADSSIINFIGNIFLNNTASCVTVLDYPGEDVTSVEGTGGGVIMSNCTGSVRGNTFMYNSGGQDGGGVTVMLTSMVSFRENVFTSNTASMRGGGVDVTDSRVDFTGNTFEGNSAFGELSDSEQVFGSLFTGSGGGVSVMSTSMVSFTENVFTNNTASEGGGGVDVTDSRVDFTGNTFEGNSAFGELSDSVQAFGNPYVGSGGGVHFSYSNFTFIENFLINNMAGVDGGGVSAEYSRGSFDQNTFTGNTAMFGEGGGASMQLATGTFETNDFTNNAACQIGGGISITRSTIAFSGKTNFLNNTVERYAGGAIFVIEGTLSFTGDTNFIVNSAVLGGAIVAYVTTISFEGNVTFECNSAQYGAAVFVLFQSFLTFDESAQFLNNRGRFGAGIYAKDANVTFAGVTSFYNNSARNGGAIYASNSNLHLRGDGNFTQNSASNGGGMLLTENSKFYLFSNTTVFFQKNHAELTGGAIKINDNTPLAYCIDDPDIAIVASSDCFFQIFPTETITTSVLFFEGNTAINGGDDVYGGVIDACRLQNDIIANSSGEVFNRLANSKAQTTSISSEALGVCRCVNNQPNCTQSSFTLQAYPGQMLQVAAATFGQRNGSTVGVIETVVDQNRIQFNSLENIQRTDSTCTNLLYSLLTSEEDSEEEITLYAEGPCGTEGKSLTINVTILPCPPGFQLAEKKCVCNARLIDFIDVSDCFIINQTILRRRDSEFWLGYDSGLILHPQCPFDYCTSDEQYVVVNDSDNQCNYNRSGKLCGSCNDTNSLVLGTSRCLPCSNSYLALILVFALAGLVLVLLLFGLKLTVAMGTINGLIFYANLVQVNSSTFYKSGSTNILTVFISWLNLDLGIETCFYSGMDTYDKTWLQFVFPIYVWVLVGMIILASRFSQRITKMLGSNPIAVLATLFLLSYAKVLRTIIAALSFTHIQYPGGVSVAVWTLDGNIEYLKGKHIPLFMIALLSLIFLFLPFTLLLFLGQWIQFLQSKYEWKVLSWINKPTLRAFLDAYYAPYTDNHRYWTGLLLLVRCVLFIVVATAGNTSTNLLGISSVITGLVTFAFATKGIYKSHSLGVLEASFFLNIVILSAATYHVRVKGGNQAAATFTLLSVVFITFIGIIVYHVFLRIRVTALWERTTEKFHLDVFKRRSVTINGNAPSVTTPSSEEIEKSTGKAELTVSTTYVELREPLLDDDY